MAKMKPNKKYYFTVEGETEKWYLKWLQEIINSTQEAAMTVSFDCQIQKNPLKRAKSIVVTGRTTIFHLADYESNEEIHRKQFEKMIDNMKEANKLGKQITYEFAYSNYTFDLWIILHKADCNRSFTHRDRYIEPLNKAYVESFENMDQYKHESNFKRILSGLTIDNVISAIDRARQIMKCNEENGYTIYEYRDYRYYKENPSLAVGEVISKILEDCHLIAK